MALVGPWGGFVLRSLCLVYAYYMALVWLWVALRGLSLLFLLSAFHFLLLAERGFARYRFGKVTCRTFPYLQKLSLQTSRKPARAYTLAPMPVAPSTAAR